MGAEYLPDDFGRADADDAALDRAQDHLDRVDDWLELKGEHLVQPTLAEAIAQEGRAKAAAARRLDGPPWAMFPDRDREGLWLVLFHDRYAGSLVLDPAVPLRSVRVATIVAALNAAEPTPPTPQIEGQAALFVVDEGEHDGR